VAFHASNVAKKTKYAEIATLLREVISKLNTDVSVLERGALFHTYTGSMNALLRKHGFVSNVGDIVSLIQLVGMARIVKNVHPTIWQISDTDYLDEILPVRLEIDLISTAVTNMKRWRHVVANNRSLRNKMPKEALNAGPHQEVLCSSELVTETAKTLAALEDAVAENETLRAEVAKLKQELDARPADMSSALADAIRKIRGK